MKKIIYLLSITLLFTVGASARADTGLSQGKWNLGAMFNLNTASHVTRYTDSTEKTSLYLGGMAQYFFADTYSAGVVASFATEGVRPTYNSLGPIATKYFMMSEKWAPYVSLIPIMWMNVDEADGVASVPSEFATSVSLGANYFITETVAFGPALNYTYFWGRDTLPTSSRFSLVGAFSVYL